MAYHKITLLLFKTSDQSSKFRTRKSVEINDFTNNWAYSPDSKIEFKTIMLKSRLCDYSVSYIPVNGIITITGAGIDAVTQRAEQGNKQVTFKNCASLTKCIRRANLETSVSRKESTPNFPKNDYFLLTDSTPTCAYQGVRKIRFLENLAWFVFLKHPFWDLYFYLITDEIYSSRQCSVSTYCYADV